jgi:hypothetical protein
MHWQTEKDGMDKPSVKKQTGKRYQCVGNGAKRRTGKYRTEHNKGDYGLESGGEHILLSLRWVVRYFEAALGDRRNEDSAHPDLETKIKRTVRSEVPEAL